jgi:hypothetical protein
MLQKNILLGAALAASLASTASAALIAYEGFNYTEANGTTLTGLNGGTGWDEAYPTVTGSGGNITLANGLSFTGHLASIGKSAERSTSATMSADGRNWDTALATGTIWYSFLLNPTATGRGTLGVVQGSGSNQNGFGIRFEPNTTATTLQINANTPAQAPGTNILFANGFGQTYLVVGKLTIDTAANTRNDVWVWQNGQTVPTNLTNASVGMSFSSGATSTAIPAFYGRAFGSPNAAVFFDEVRIGTTFADVSAIPEPSSFVALAGLGAIGMVASRRRRQA